MVMQMAAESGIGMADKMVGQKAGLQVVWSVEQRAASMAVWTAGPMAVETAVGSAEM